MKKILLVLLMVSQSALAQVNLGEQKNTSWTLNNQASSLIFVTTKNASKTEVQSFEAIKGQIKNKKASLSIDLTSVVTGIEIRDERIKDLFFETKLFPQAKVSINLANSKIGAMEVGEVKNIELDALLDIHGVKQKLPLKAQVILLKNKTLLVNSVEPLIVNLQKFKLLEGVNLLREIAHLKSINAAIPVSFNLMFTQQ
jgi:polyisoprenoid-binding protein YceI